MMTSSQLWLQKTLRKKSLQEISDFLGVSLRFLYYVKKGERNFVLSRIKKVEKKELKTYKKVARYEREKFLRKRKTKGGVRKDVYWFYNPTSKTIRKMEKENYYCKIWFFGFSERFEEFIDIYSTGFKRFKDALKSIISKCISLEVDFNINLSAIQVLNI